MRAVRAQTLHYRGLGKPISAGSTEILMDASGTVLSNSQSRKMLEGASGGNQRFTALSSAAAMPLRRFLATAPHVWTNIVLAPDKYLITFHCDRGVCPNPMDARGIALEQASPDDELVMRFHLLLGQAIEVTRVCSLPYWEYLSAAKLWSAEIRHAVTEDGVSPPCLSTLMIG